jgi:hypothetical protein
MLETIFAAKVHISSPNMLLIVRVGSLLTQFFATVRQVLPGADTASPG